MNDIPSRRRQEMTAKRYKEIVENYNFRRDGSGRFLGINGRTSRRYASGEPIPRVIAMLLELMVKTGTSPVEALMLIGYQPNHIKHMNMFKDDEDVSESND